MAMACARIRHESWSEEMMFEAIYDVRRLTGLAEETKTLYFGYWGGNRLKSTGLNDDDKRRLEFFFWMYETALIEERNQLEVKKRKDSNFEKDMTSLEQQEQLRIEKIWQIMTFSDYDPSWTVKQQLDKVGFFDKKKDILENRLMRTRLGPMFRDSIKPPSTWKRVTSGSSDHVPAYDKEKDRDIGTWLEWREQKRKEYYMGSNSVFYLHYLRINISYVSPPPARIMPLRLSYYAERSAPSTPSQTFDKEEQLFTVVIYRHFIVTFKEIAFALSGNRKAQIASPAVAEEFERIQKQPWSESVDMRIPLPPTISDRVDFLKEMRRKMRSSTVGALAKGFKREEGCEDPHVHILGLGFTSTPMTGPIPDASEEQTNTYIHTWSHLFGPIRILPNVQ
ncbi:MAG: hypothetical protein Q9202_005403 [Teloschistes flavicans]